VSKRVNPRVSEEDEPHPSRGLEEPAGPGFEITEGDAPTGEGYYEGEPGEETSDDTPQPPAETP
jgi:hypothetical protein